MLKTLIIFAVAIFGLLNPAWGQTRDVSVTGGNRVALVIGNNTYKFIPTLQTAVEDSAVLKRELEARGFRVVYRADATRQAMNRAMDEFVGLLSSDSIALVYYAGHGVQIRGTNYLIPIDLEAQRDTDVANDAVELQRLLDRVSQTHAKFALAIIDACRNNPFAATTAGRSIGTTRGLVTSNAAGMMVMYSAGANQQALDKLNSTDADPNGLFTRELVKAMRKPGLTVQDVLNQTRREVTAKARSVNHIQTPALYDESDGGSFYFTDPIDTAATSQTAVASVPPSSFDPRTAELSFWDSIRNSTAPEDFQAYLEKYPNGEFAALARRRSAPAPLSQPVPQVATLSPPPDTTAVLTTRLPEGTPKVQYDYAFDLLRRQDYAAAATTLREFLKQNPTDPLAGNAQYWLGETFYVRGDFQQAAVEFMAGYQNYPKGNKAPDNLLKLAMAMDKLNQQQGACTAFGRIKKDYPEAPAAIAAQANAERARLKCK